MRSTGDAVLQILAFAAVLFENSAQTPPVITKQPVAQSVSLGSVATFSVTATGTPSPVYQWQHNGRNFPAATNRLLKLEGIALTNAGSYRVVVSNGLGMEVSAAAELDVDPTFNEIVAPLFNIAGGASGASWSDINNDGALDLFVVGKGGGSILLTNRGDGSFGKGVNTGFTGSGLGGAPFADIDNDGYADLFLGGANLYRNISAGKFALTNAIPGASGTYCAAWGDYDNDGFVDLFCGNYYTGGANFLYHNNGNGSFTRVTDLAPARDRSYSQGIAWVDYDNDGRLDLFVANTSAQKCFLYHNDGSIGFTKITNNPAVSIAGNFSCGAWGDYDNDGSPDLFLCGFRQRRLLFRNEGSGSFTQVLTAGLGQDSGDDQSASWVDIDNDGHLDLFVCGGGPTYGLKDALYRNNGDGSFSRQSRGSLVNDAGEGAAAAWGDFDRDGFPDVFITNFQNLGSGAKSNFLYRNNGNSNSWITVRLIGRISNRSGIGAKVRVTATITGRPRQQLREISGGGAYITQNSSEAMFGLGDANLIDSIRVEWPSGIVEELRSIAARQVLTITEPSRLSAPKVLEGKFSFRVPGRNENASLESSTNLKAWVTLTNLSTDGQFHYEHSATNSAAFFRAVDLSRPAVRPAALQPPQSATRAENSQPALKTAGPSPRSANLSK
jgi:hypothetical protein